MRARPARACRVKINKTLSSYLAAAIRQSRAAHARCWRLRNTHGNDRLSPEIEIVVSPVVGLKVLQNLDSCAAVTNAD
jgi:hypothetical protein